MKSFFPVKHIPLLLFILVLILFSCKSQKNVQIPNKDFEQKYNTSLKKWNQVKKEHKDSYEYSISFSSFIGYSNTTTVTVKEGKIIAREFSETVQDEQGNFNEERTIYQEKGNEVNSDKNGFKAILFDQIYQDCGNNYLQQDEQMNHLYFDVDGIGILKHCSYFPKNCMDDCSTGVTVSRFKWL